MFYIIPFSGREDLSGVNIYDYLEPILSNNDAELYVMDSKDMIVERVSVKVVKNVIRKHLAKFPQLKLSNGELFISDNYMSICGILPIFFIDKKYNHKIKIKESTKSFKEYNKVFDAYIKRNNIIFEDNDNEVEYTAKTFKVSGSNTRLTLSVTIQGIVDNYGRIVATALFVNNKFITYVKDDFGYSNKEVDILAIQFYKEDNNYCLTLFAPLSSQFITVRMSSMLKFLSIERLDTVMIRC